MPVRSSIRVACLTLALTGCESRAHTASDAGPAAVDATADDGSRHTPEASTDGGLPKPTDSGMSTSMASDAGQCPAGLNRTFEVVERSGDQPMFLGRGAAPNDWLLDGEVVAHGAGLPADDWPAFQAPPPMAAKLSYLRIRAGDRTWTVVASDIPSFGVSDGVTVHASYHFVAGGFGPNDAAFSLSVGNELAFHFAAAGGVSSLDAPVGWSIAQADELCEGRSSCGAWGTYRVTIAAVGGDSKRLGPGETAQLGDYTIAGASSQNLPMSGATCADWFVSASQLLIARTQPLGAASWTCNPKASSTLSGVEVRFDAAGPCQFTRAQARAGIDIPYTLVVAHDVAGVSSHALDIGGCSLRPAGELSLFEALEGNGQYYGLRDIGGCGGERSSPPATLRAGTSAHMFHWDGRNWMGPSDTTNPEGAEFPAGVYTLSVSGRGTVAADGGEDGGAPDHFMLEGSMDILLTD